MALSALFVSVAQNRNIGIFFCCCNFQFDAILRYFEALSYVMHNLTLPVGSYEYYMIYLLQLQGNAGQPGLIGTMGSAGKPVGKPPNGFAINVQE